MTDQEFVKDNTLLGKDPLHMSDLPLKRVPDYMRKRGGFMYWTGALISVALIYQIISGLILLLYYNPALAYNSTEAVIETIPYGALILTTHLYGAYAMIVLIYVHMFRNYFMGAYKKPRILQWMSGVILLATTIGVGFFGYSMTGDVLSSDATDVGRGIAEAVPFLGKTFESIFFGNGTSVSLFTHLLAWHVILVLVIGAIFGLHFFLAEANGIMPSNRVSKHKAPAIDKEDPNYKPWNPYNFAYMIQLGMIALGIIIIIPAVLMLLPSVPTLFSPFPQVPSTSVFAAFVPTYPPWFLLFVYKAIDFTFLAADGAYEALAATVIFAVIPLVYFIAVPFIDRSDDLHPLARPLVTSFGILSIIYLAILSLWGSLAPGIPISNSIVAAVLVPPFVIVVGGMYFLNRQYVKGKFKVSPNRVLTSFLIFLFLLCFTFITLSENIGTLMTYGNGINVLATLFAGGATAFAAVGTMKSAQFSYQVKAKQNTKNSYQLSKNTAMVLTSLLSIASIAIVVIISKLNPVSIPQEGVFGIGLGIVLILAGIVLRIYRAAYYNE